MTIQEDLQTQLSGFEDVLAVRFTHLAASSAARALREIYATKSSSAVLACVRALFPEEVDLVRQTGRTEDRCRSAGTEVFALARELARTGDQSSLRPPLPNLDAVRNAAARLLEAVSLQNGIEAMSALGEMGVLALCPPPEQQFGRLEFSVGSIVGGARLIPLVELAVLAAELGVYDRASVYLAEAHTLSPRPAELHSLYTVSGMIDLSDGKVAEAKRDLTKSASVCREDKVACSVHGLNPMLAEKLLEHGEETAVIDFLRRGRDVWTHHAKRITSWIEEIQRGETPDFRARGILDHPTIRLQLLVTLSDFL